MGVRMRLTALETVNEEGSWLFTVRNRNGERKEVIVVPCDGGVEAWSNRCTHEAQPFDTGRGAPIRNAEIVCPRHGSMFDACSGKCDNGPAADTTLPGVEVELEDGDVYLTDDDVQFLHEGGIDDGDDGPSSTSHISF
ncbi:Rieske (2Fe-2S) protein [Natronobacterium gregoryi]|uniref:Ferredoxin subunit of nitrite reductase and ring-hydroxylating dioxygenase n=2 Tax=Natronobacterium gregoryi TaxID=44930 RepID=L0AD59_NATGS|nr:Rieske (2Fe-2S) protein [Natronobacterium gregoryi]AFZ71364.1 ferredoxin subunit of nitrite reductase and ring-hydroxylating dioxygenase [Natronobacterium gregoryi SP2]ELY67019.1 Rieske (2Fe-2S) iron-sulfur domain-containing protein [Natronobacterium gregoryi SP2]PLK21255.1 Rieske (2Fe-2S) protein [Natronobacterium gregoryi SP2]SFI85365.1 Ferredoxin subunit of nitrite reductase or a ring-hydroxylating dioxygenase [Natronobacterium gregoryi]